MSNSCDIALVALNARFSHSNLAVRYLRNSVNAAGFTAKIIEMNTNDRKEDILRSLYFADAAYYGFSVYIWNIELALAVAIDLKKLKPESKLIFGGPEVSFYGQEFFEKHPYIDALIQGEGENALPEYLKNRPDKKIIQGIPADFQTIPFPYLEEDFFSLKNKMIYYETSRGCPFSCTYCLSGDNGRVQAKSVEMVKEEVLKLLKFSPKVIKLTDRTFNFDKKRARELILFFCALETNAVFHLEICASLLEDEDFMLLSKAPKGRIQLEVGVQSTNKETLKAVKREPVETKQLKRLSELSHVPLHLDLIAGLPYENIETFQQSFDSIYPFAGVLQLGFLKLLHGTAIRKDAFDYQMVFSEKAPYELLKNNWLSFEDISKLKEIEETLERFSNSGFFKHSLSFALTYFSSAFSFFEEFSRFLILRDGLFSNISREMDFEALFLFGEEKEFPEEFFCRLKLDYTLLFRGKLPFFSYDYGKDFSERCFAFFKNNTLTERFLPHYFGIPAKQILKHCDIHKIGDKIYLFDRQNKEYFDITSDF